MPMGHHLLLRAPREAEVNRDTWTKVKKLVNERDGGSCIVCGSEAQAVHHRQVRGQGGSSDPDRNYGMANLVSLCAFHHAETHANPESAYKSGLLVHSWDNPVDCPILLANDTILIYLAADGNITKFQQQTLF